MSLLTLFSQAVVGSLKTVSFAVSEVSTHVAAVMRGRSVSASIVEAETQTASGSRSRRVSASQSLAESQAVSVRRDRATASTIIQAESQALAVRRLRAQLLAVAESQGVSAAVGRTRGLLMSIAETTGMTFTFVISGSLPSSLVLTVSWNEWVVSPTASGAKAVLTPFSKVIPLNLKVSTSAIAPSTLTATGVAPAAAF